MLQDMFGETVARHPEKTAVVCAEGRYSFGRLERGVAATTGALRASGVGFGDCLVAVLPNGIAFVRVFLAAARLGCVLVPLSPQLTRRELVKAIRECRGRLVVVEQRRLATYGDLGADAGRPITILGDDELGAPDSVASPAAPNCGGSDPADAPFLVQYSSGSTGRPKRICRTQRNLWAEAGHFSVGARITSDDTILCVVPLFHAHGLGNCLLAAVRTGATLVILEPLAVDGSGDAPFASRVGRVWELIESESVTVFPGVPYMFAALADGPFEERDLADLRVCFSAGNHLPKATFDSFLRRFGIAVRQLYGCTEAGSVTMNLDADVISSWDSVGRPFGGVKVRIVDERGHDAAEGATGEVAVASPALTSGYLDTSQDDEAFRDGYFFPGDLGRLDETGRLYVTGRKKLFIDTGGHKVDPLEIEDVLVTHPAIAEAVVVGVKTRAGDEIVKAVIVCRAASSIDEVLAYCRERLADFKVPRAIEVVEGIPRSPLGKVLRKDLLRDLDGADRHEGPERLRHAVDAIPSSLDRRELVLSHVATEVASLLGIDRDAVDRQRPLMMYGLTSVMAVDLCRRLEHAVGTELPTVLVWNYPTGAAIADYLLETIGRPGGQWDGSIIDPPRPGGAAGAGVSGSDLDDRDRRAERDALEAIGHMSDTDLRHLMVRRRHSPSEGEGSGAGTGSRP